MNIQSHIKGNKYIIPTARLLVGVSGGVDSVVLLHALHAIGMECVVAHCNFNLRGEDSDGDQEFVEQLAERYNYKCEVISFATEDVAKDKGISIEMAARYLRYGWFEEKRRDHLCDYIVVAHNMNDMVETFMLNITRGTGIRGVSGMQELRKNILRPMLGISRDDIEHYAQECCVEWRNDYTNKETIYLRNKIRHEILPLFEEVNPSFFETMKKNMEHFSEVEKVYHSYSKQAKERCYFEDGKRITIDLEGIKSYTSFKTILFSWLQELGISATLATQVTENLDSISGKRYYYGDYIIVKDRTLLLIENIEKRDEGTLMIGEAARRIDVPIGLDIEQIEAISEIDRNKNVATLDRDSLTFPLELRVWKQGDRFSPLGMKGSKKVSDLLSDLKVSVLDKENVYVLLSAGEIVWVVGYRIDRRFSIKPSTKRAVKITVC